MLATAVTAPLSAWIHCDGKHSLRSNGVVSTPVELHMCSICSMQLLA